MCAYIYLELYIRKHVCLWVYASTDLHIFGICPAVGKEGKVPSAVSSLPVSFRSTKGHILVPACVLITVPAAATFSPVSGLSPSTAFLFPHPRQCDRLWDGHVTQDFFGILLLELAGKSISSLWGDRHRKGLGVPAVEEWVVRHKEAELRERNKKGLDPVPPFVTSYMGQSFYLPAHQGCVAQRLVRGLQG